MQDNLFRKGLVLIVIILSVGTIITPSVSKNIVMNIYKNNELEIIEDNNQIKNKEQDYSYNTDWWPMFHHDLNHSGYSTSSAPETNNVLWNFSEGGGSSSPSIYNGKVYISASNLKVYCLDIFNGTEIWSYYVGGNYGIRSSPAVSNGKVFVGSFDNNVYCLNAENGSKIWNFTTGDYVLSSPAVINDKVYIASFDGKVYCLDANNGTEIWNFFTYGGDWWHTSPAISNGKIFIGSYYGWVYCIDAENGTELWKFGDYDHPNQYHSSAAVYDGKVYIGADDGNIYCLDSDNGTKIWNYTTEYMVQSSPAVAYGKVYIGVYGNLLCLNATNGLKIWNYTTNGYFITSSTAVADGKVYISIDKLYCLDAENGTLIWNSTIGGFGYPIICNGKVFVGGLGKTFCFGENNQPPTVDITYPEEGETVSGTITITGNADDLNGTVELVEIKIEEEGDWQNATGTDSWTYEWDTTTVPNGEYTIYARSFDGEDYSVNDTVNVTVDNSGNIPPNCIIKLQIDGEEINNIDVKKFFDIYVGESNDDGYITEVWFSSDDKQDGIPQGIWDGPYQWDSSSGDWDAESKIKKWSFNTGGYKEVWAKVKDNGEIAKTDEDNVSIYVNFYFIHLTDSHVLEPIPVLEYYDLEGSRDKWDHIIKKMTDSFDPSPGFVILSGDLVDCGAGPVGEDNYDTFISYLQGSINNWFLDSDFQIPIYFCPGNHDYRQWLKDFGSNPFWGFNLYNYQHIICSDENYWIRDDNTKMFIVTLNSGRDIRLGSTTFPPRGSGFEPEQLDWLEDKLDVLDGLLDKQDSSGYKKIVFMHHPVIYYRIDPWLDDKWDAGCITKGNKRFMDICDQYGVDLVISGHTHENRVYDRSMNGSQDFSDQNGYNNEEADGMYYPLLTSQVKPLYVITGANIDEMFRMIECRSDGFLVYQHNTIIDSVTCKVIGCPVELHLFDSFGNHVGKNDTEGVDFEITNATYSFNPLEYINGTNSSTWNHTIEKISLQYGIDNYRYELRAYKVGCFNFSLEKKLNDGTEMLVLYRNISISENSSGELYVFEDSINLSLFWDDDGDGTVDRVIDPDEIIYQNVPYPPSTPSGPSIGNPGKNYKYNTVAIDPEDNNVFYCFDWGDGLNSSWLGPYSSGEICEAEHSWVDKGDFEIKVKAKDIFGYESDWSDLLLITIKKSKSINNLFLRFIENYPFLYQLLQLMLQKLGL